MKAPNQKYLRHIYLFTVIFIIGLLPCPIMGQSAPKKHLSPEDYHLWGTLHTEYISEKGKWISYMMSYEANIDTLFVKNTATAISYSLPKGTDGRFAGDHAFAYFNNSTELNLLNLFNGTKLTYSNVVRFDFSSDGSYLLTVEKAAGKESTLIIRKTNGQLITSIEGIVDYKMNNSGDAILYTSNVGGSNSVGIVALASKCHTKEIITNSKYSFKKLTWKEDGQAVSFYGQENENTELERQLYMYRIKSKKLLHLTLSEQPDFPSGKKISTESNLRLSISDDGTKVFFAIEQSVQPKAVTDSSAVEIWNGNDKILYPNRKLALLGKNPSTLAVWWPDTKKMRQINTSDQSWIMLTGNQSHAISANPQLYEPQYEIIADMDYYLTDIQTGESSILLRKHSGQVAQIGVSPDGKYISYYQDGNWWIYTISERKHTNLTIGMGISWDSKETDPSYAVSVFGNPGWTSDGKFILVYDTYDIWAISPDGLRRKKLTNGKGKNLRYRLIPPETKVGSHGNYSAFQIRSFNLKSKLYLRCLDMETNATGYCNLMPTGTLVPLAMGNVAIDRLLRARANDVIVYQEQSYNVSPHIVIKISKDSPAKTIVESNKQQSGYYWGKSEIIHYNANNRNLKGALFYPSDYSPTIKYPMIVHIYESTMSLDIHKYVNPSEHNTIGFNISNLTAKGYFVLLADIGYGTSEPGKSATQSVTAAVQKVVDKGLVDSSKIGLIGHSFGGYETNIIITQSNIFSAAVSGSSVSDIISSYFTFGLNTGKIDAWRYENQQFRIGKSFYDDQEVYYRNSPIVHATNIATPLLTWAGDEDDNVRSQQSAEFYAALRRLQKKHIMLVYPEEGHAILKEGNQKDLTKRTEDWFDHFLKRNTVSSWITNGTL